MWIQNVRTGLGRWLLVGVAGFALCRAEPGALLQTAASGRFDLEVKGLLEDVPEGESRWVKWSDLRALPTREITVEGEFVPGPQRVTVVFLDDLLKSLPTRAEADVVLADCADGYAAVYTRDFIARWRPFVVLEINGAGPENWPPAGLTFNPGPFVISVSDAVAPGAEQLLDVPHKRPWGVNRLRFARQEEAFRAFATGEWAGLPEAGLRGRELWINSCHSCHKGPGEEMGGTKAGRPFAVLRAHAQYNADYFRNYVLDPQKVNPSAKMTAHPHYTGEQLADLIAFITARKP